MLRLQKSSKNYDGWCSMMKFVQSLLHKPTVWEFCVWSKALKVMTSAQNWRKTANILMKWPLTCGIWKNKLTKIHWGKLCYIKTQQNHIDKPLNRFSERVQQGLFLWEVLKLPVELSWNLGLEKKLWRSIFEKTMSI